MQIFGDRAVSRGRPPDVYADIDDGTSVGTATCELTSADLECARGAARVLRVFDGAVD